MAGLSPTQKQGIYEMLKDAPLTIQKIADKLGLTGKTGYQQVSRFLRGTKAKIHFLVENVDSVLWFRANVQNPLFFSAKSLDLICDKQNSEKTEMKPETTTGVEHDQLSHLARASPERLTAILKLNRIQSLGHYEDNEWIEHNRVRAEVQAGYSSYCNRVEKERLDMAYSPTGSPVFYENYSMKYKTRFTDQGRQDANISGFRAAWDTASRGHCVAVELTLTARPYGYSSLYECNRATLTALEKFMDFMKYHLPDHSQYITVREFQQNGRIHFHITFFGINWLKHKSVIQYAWRKYGGGEILDIHTIRRRGNTWHWSNSRPDDATGQPPYDHLRKYLEKSMTAESGYMFWAMGCRNWTCSQSLLPEKIDKSASKTKIKHILRGIKSKITGYRVSNRSDSKAFFAGALVKTRKSSTAPPKDSTPKPESFPTGFRRASDLSSQC